MCAGGEPGKDSCSGDSGGGLFSDLINGTDGKERKWAVVGIVSQGTNRCGDGTPAVYTRVGQYLQWIEETMKLMIWIICQFYFQDSIWWNQQNILNKEIH